MTKGKQSGTSGLLLYGRVPVYSVHPCILVSLTTAEPSEVDVAEIQGVRDSLVEEAVRLIEEENTEASVKPDDLYGKVSNKQEAETDPDNLDDVFI